MAPSEGVEGQVEGFQRAGNPVDAKVDAVSACAVLIDRVAVTEVICDTCFRSAIDGSAAGSDNKQR
jgi:hypothetical protein